MSVTAEYMYTHVTTVQVHRMNVWNPLTQTIVRFEFSDSLIPLISSRVTAALTISYP